MNLKKTLFCIVTIIYDIVALFWCYVITSDIIYELTSIGVNEGSIGIIGGADLPTLTFMLQTGAIFSFILHITLALLNIVIPLLLTIAAFRTKTNRALNIWLIVLLGACLIINSVVVAQNQP